MASETPWEVDLVADRAQWEAMQDRTWLAFVLGSLMVAEERITAKFSGLVGADAAVRGASADELRSLRSTA